MPWLYVRDVLARRYAALPGAIDEMPVADVLIALDIMTLEADNPLPER